MCRHELKIALKCCGHRDGAKRLGSFLCRWPRRPARKDRLAPYRLPEGVRLPGKLRQDQAIGSILWALVFFVFFGWPFRQALE